MPYSDDNSAPSRERNDRGSRDDDRDRYRRSAPRGDPRLAQRPRRNVYDASDEDDESPKGRRGGSNRHGSLPTGSHGEPDIPHPPLGEDRDKDDSRHRRRPRRAPLPGGDDDEADDGGVGRRKPRRRGDDDDDRGVGRRRSLHRPRDDPRDDPDRPRRKSLGRDFAPGGDARHRRDRPRHAEVDDARPRRRRDDRPRHEDGYGTDRPRRRPRDDDHDRGYRTDGRDRRREHRKHDDRRDRDREHRRDSARHHDPDEGPRRSDPKGNDFQGLMETGKKHWNTVEPIAKPLLAQLAKKYLEV